MFADGERAGERNRLRKGCQHRDGGFSDPQAVDFAAHVREVPPHRLRRVNRPKSRGQDAQDARVAQAAGLKTRCVHIGYHNRNDLWSDHDKAKSIRDEDHPRQGARSGA
ncbi:MAG: hypothetical protein MZV64_60465 [Ignavibacteriales bacterium]|nr:hypothetical protein [Ignavibacteriales bacterium]